MYDTYVLGNHLKISFWFKIKKKNFENPRKLYGRVTRVSRIIFKAKWGSKVLNVLT